MTVVIERPTSIFPDGFMPPTPEIAVFMTALITHVNSNEGIVAQIGTNLVHFNHIPRRKGSIFFTSFYYERPLELTDGTFLLGGIDRTDGHAEIEGRPYDLYLSHDLVYDQTQEFGVVEIQSGTPIPFYGKDAITVWERRMSKGSIQRLSRKLLAMA